ncbi:MAG: putative sulfotransferase [Acidimicrobiia bacterium]
MSERRDRPDRPFRPDRPDWVDAVNRGEIWPMADVAAAPFTVDRIAGEAASRLGIEPGEVTAGLGDAALEGLEVLLPALETEASLTVLGRWITHRFIGRLVEQRLALDAYCARDPGTLDDVIAAPWFVIGAPRTGTTILYGVLAQDPRHRVPEGWELLRPAPPPIPETRDRDVRIALADTELRTPQVVMAGLTAIHEYSGRMPKECLSAMSLGFRSEEFVARYHVPSYVTWLQRCDMRPAYEVHRRVLQVLQRRSPPRRWLLKSPVHLQSLDVLLSVYPDARCSFTHRDPLAVLASVTSLLATMRAVHRDHVDVPAIGRYHADLYSRSLDRLVDACDTGLLDPARVTHTAFRDFVDGPMTVVESIYSQLGLDLPADTARVMAAYLADHPQGRHGAHEYSFDDLGLDAPSTRARFGRYRARFGTDTGAVV